MYFFTGFPLSELRLAGFSEDSLRHVCRSIETRAMREVGIFPTRFECNFTSSPLVSSVVFQAVLLGSYDPILKQEEYSFGNSYLDLREKNIRVYSVKLHSKRVEKM